ncbi:hypothetical protein FPV67DRAFT_874695 [Lyophyllum atratum]|nr:hypothetical protein FPV67DRAFT_874695 [Lyophyllum atratum]
MLHRRGEKRLTFLCPCSPLYPGPCPCSMSTVRKDLLRSDYEPGTLYAWFKLFALFSWTVIVVLEHETLTCVPSRTWARFASLPPSNFLFGPLLSHSLHNGFCMTVPSPQSRRNFFCMLRGPRSRGWLLRRHLKGGWRESSCTHSLPPTSDD